MAINNAKYIPIKPTGLMDFRSDSGDVPVGHSRVNLNLCVTEANRPRRAAGWTALFRNSEFGFFNQDLHEQLIDSQNYYDDYSTEYYQDYVGYYDYEYCGYFMQTRGGCRESITHLVQFDNELTTRRLLAFTQKRIYELNERGANWRLLADGLGSEVLNTSFEDCTPCIGPRWMTAQLLGYLIMTNGTNNVLSYRMGDSPDGCNLWSVRTVTDLVDLNIPRAGVVAQFKGFILLADIEQDGVRRPGRVLWSDFNEPLSYLPLPGTSLAGFADVGFSERVLRMEPLGDYLMVYTEKAIYRTQLVLRQEASGVVSEVFHFTEVYRGPHALRYKYSLINTGTEHIYAALDGIYVISNPFANVPSRVEFIHRASGVIYKGAVDWEAEFHSLPDDISSSLQFGPINQDSCDNFIGAYNPLTKEIWFSWPTDENICPNVSLRIGLQYPSASIVDHGFTAFVLYRSDSRVTFEQWLEENEVCLATEFSSPKQGEMQNQDVGFDDPPPYLFNENESLDEPIADDSFCARLGNQTIDDLCTGCDAEPIFIGASASDFTLKEFSEDAYYREHWNGSDYDSLGYPTLIQSGAMNFNSEWQKVVHGLKVGYKALPQTEPSLLHAMAGFGAQAECPMWKDIGTRELKCLTEKTLAQHEAAKTRPSLDAEFPSYYRGHELFYRLYIQNTGGGTSINRVDMKVRNAQT